MNNQRVERICWTVATLALAVSTAAWLRPTPVGTATARLVVAQARAPSLLDEDSLSRASDVTLDGDPFRLDRANVTADAPPPTTSVQTIARPKLALRGLIGGPPWDVILDGIPGKTAGAVVRDRETISGLTVRVMSRESVRVQGVDTTWLLVLGHK